MGSNKTDEYNAYIKVDGQDVYLDVKDEEIAAILDYVEKEEKDEDMIKRLIGLPGDKVIIKDGVVSVNGETLQENYIGTADNYTGEFEVPEGKYFFLGDNRYWSLDSRYWNDPYIDGSEIKGKAQIKVYPWKDFGKIE